MGQKVTGPHGEVYRWDGVKWTIGHTRSARSFVLKAGDTMTGDLTVPNMRFAHEPRNFWAFYWDAPKANAFDFSVSLNGQAIGYLIRSDNDQVPGEGGEYMYPIGVIRLLKDGTTMVAWDAEGGESWSWQVVKD